MKFKRNPKYVGSSIFNCRPQTGLCSVDCNQCFYNRPGVYYNDINEPNIPSVEEVGDGIVRMNGGHDSNFQRSLVIETAKQYRHFFFNTSIPKFDFPGPVVFTANPEEEEEGWFLPNASSDSPENLMFVRLRVSSSNLHLIDEQVSYWTQTLRIPVVLTLMAYYEANKMPGMWFSKSFDRLCVGEAGGCNFKCYEWKKRHINEYWCPTREFKEYVLKRMKVYGGRLVTLCGTLDSNYCQDCRNCETYYWQTIKHLQEINYHK